MKKHTISKMLAVVLLSVTSSSAFAVGGNYGIFTLGSSNEGTVLSYDLDADMALGDLNISFDRMHLTNGFGNVGHVRPSLSLKKIINQKDLSFDIKLTGGMEGMHTDLRGHDVAYLYGVEMELNQYKTPNMDVTLKLHALVRDNVNFEGNTQQIGGSINAAFIAIGNKFVFNAEVDVIGDEGKREGFVRSKAFFGVDLINLFSGHTKAGGHVVLGGGFNRNLFNEEDAEVVPYFGIQAAF